MTVVEIQPDSVPGAGGGCGAERDDVSYPAVLRRTQDGVLDCCDGGAVG